VTGDYPVFGTHDANTLSQMAAIAARPETVRAALMADGHLGYEMPIGGVAAFRGHVPVAGVGFDIACGNCAALTDLRAHDLTHDDLGLIGDEIQRVVSFGVGRTNPADDAPMDDPLFDASSWRVMPEIRREELRQKARHQLGTVGSGNHYVDVLADEAGRIWVGVHFGSRGLGHSIASDFLALSAGRSWGDRVPEHLGMLDLAAPIGTDYWELMTLAGEYAHVGREWVVEKVVGILGGHITDKVHNHHNFGWREEHGGESLIVVRKGATPAFPGQRGFVGGSMGDDAVILRGAPASSASETALFSTVHGAGRVMSRTEARGKVNRKTGAVIRPGKVTQEMLTDWLGPRGVVLRGGGLDEAPQAYRRLPDVLAAQGETVVVEHTLTPVVVVMAGANEFDPYKD